VQQFPTLTWKAVHGAAEYEYQIAADRRFNSIVLGSGTGKGTSRTYNLAASLAKDLADGTYYWRVRALTAKDKLGRWSPVRRIVKRWTLAPALTTGNGVEVNWPTTPLVLGWSSVPYASKYIVTIATDPALSNVVLGTVRQPVETQGTNFALPSSLDPGAYYWAITPLDAQGHRGTRSAVGSFTWTWPTTTTTSVTDLNPDPRVFDPLFSWAPVPGASRYELEVNATQDFAPGSKWCCSGTTIGTTVAPLKVLANNRYYWRVRAFDAKGNAGVWNEGAPFTKQFDSVEPSIPNLTVRNASGEALTGVPSTDAPIVTWDPVPGASHYEVQLVPHSAFGCDWSQVHPHAQIYQAETATTAWTPLGDAGGSADHIGPTAWPRAQDTVPALPTEVEYCLRVLARSDDDAQGGQVVSDWTQLNGLGEAAFTYAPPPPAGTPEKPFVTPASSYIQPQTGTLTPRTPLFTWRRVPGAEGYYVVIARDAAFTEVADVGFTNVPAYAPRLENEAPLSDETTSYYWAVIPAAGHDGSGAFEDIPQRNSPQAFDKSSVPPTLLSPASGALVTTQPTFEWTGAENARTYRFQVAQDASFGHPLEDVTTDATAYTPTTTYPADTVLYWRVRANDWTGQGLNWSQVETFVRSLAAPTLDTAASGGPSIPTLAWTPVQGAIGYTVQTFEPNGKTKTTSFEAPSATVVKYYGTGVWRWQVRAEFPSGLGTSKVAGAYSQPREILLTLPAPSAARGTKSGSRLLVSWSPAPWAKEYEVQVARSSGFTSKLESRRVAGTSWAPNINRARKRSRGTLYWRVAAVDGGGNVGAFASGAFGKPKAHPKCKKGHRGKARKCAKRRHR
jgi:hypothetical protein